MKIEEDCGTCANKITCRLGNMRKCEYKSIVEEAIKAREKRSGRYMKIIFDREEEKEKTMKVIKRKLCPRHLGMEEDCLQECEKCWENAIKQEPEKMKVEVKGDKRRMLNAKDLKEFLEDLEKEKNVNLEETGVYINANGSEMLERANEVDYDGEDVNIWA